MTDHPPRASRRRLLASLGSAVGLAGCSGSFLIGQESGPSPPTTTGQESRLSPPTTTETADRPALVVDLSGTQDPVEYWDWLTFVCLQGIVNRSGRKLYLSATPHDDTWREWYANRYGLPFEPLSDPYAVFEQVNPVEGCVLVDRNELHTANIAANYAAIDDLLPVTESFLQRESTPDLTVQRDLNGQFEGMDRAEIYRWAVENQWPDANQFIVANVLLPNADGSEPVPNFRKWEQNVRDYIVTQRGFCFELSSDPADEADYEVRSRILREMDSDGYVMGWSTRGKLDTEFQYVTHASEYGHPVVMTSQVANLSFHQYVGRDTEFDRPDNRGLSNVTVDEDAVYVTFVLSDGDAVGALYEQYFSRWNSAERGGVPLGWEMQPLMADLAPGIMSYYYENATDSEEFVASASGIGYVFPSIMPRRDLQTYLERTKPYLKRADLDTLTVLTADPTSRAIAELYSDVLGDQLYGAVEGYWHDPNADIHDLDRMAWLPTRLPEWDEENQELAQQTGAALADRIDELARKGPRPMFLPVHLPIADGFFVEDAFETVEQLDTEAVTVVKPSEFFLRYVAASV